MTTKEVAALVKMLRKNGVEYYKTQELELKLLPSKVNSIQSVNDLSKSNKVTDDDLYYSSTNLKPKVK